MSDNESRAAILRQRLRQKISDFQLSSSDSQGIPHRSLTVAALMCLALLVAGCAQLTPPDSRAEAQHRWTQVRARLKCQIAFEAFTSGNLAEAQKHLGEALALEPEMAEAFVLRARIQLERGETASAAEALDAALRYGGDTPETDYLSGTIAQRYGRFDNALAWYERAADRDPMSAHYLVSVAETLVALGRLDDALELVRQRWTDFENNATLRALAGGIHMMLDQYEEAANAYRDAFRISPDDRMLAYQLGLALTLAAHYSEAAAVFTSATAGDQEHPAHVLAAFGRCRLELKQPIEARDLLRRAVQADPNNARAWILLAQASLACGDRMTARQAAGRAADIDPASTEHAMLLGYVCWTQQDYPAAVAALEQVLRSNPRDVLAQYLLEQCRQAG